MRNLVYLLCLIASFGAHAQSAYPSSTWILIRENCKVGYMDPSGKMCIPPQFEEASAFKEGLAFVWSFPGYEKDREQVPLGEDYVNYERFNLDGNRRTGIIDSTGNFIVKPQVNFEFYSHFEDGVALVEINNEVVFIDRSGKVLSPFDRRMDDERMTDIRRISQYGTHLPRQYCFVDAGRVMRIGPFDEVAPFSGNRAAVRMGEYFGYVSRDGDMKIIPQFKYAGIFVDGYATVSIVVNQDDQQQLRYGVIDTNGVFVIPPIHDYLGDPSQGYVVFGINSGDASLYGLLNMKGKVILPAKYAGMQKYSEGLIPVQQGKKYGYVDLSGKLVIKAKYTYAPSFRNGAASVRISETKVAVINSSGKIIYGPFLQSGCD